LHAHAANVQSGLYQGTVQEVQVAEKDFNIPHQTWVGFLPGNDEFDPLHKVKRRATLVVHHEEPKTDKHYVIVWFHGMGGFHQFKKNMYPQLKELAYRGKSFTLVEPELPWSCNVSHIDGRQSWKKKGSFKLLVDSAIKVVPRLLTSKQVIYVVGGHSRGGKSIMSSSESDDLCDLNPDWVIWSDATYSDWLKRAWKACLKNIPGRVEIFYIKGTSTENSVSILKNDMHFDFVHVYPLGIPWYHGKVGDNALTLSEVLK
jgi:hypothetical protein